MNPEVESTRAKITQTSTDSQLQTTMDCLGRSQDRRNSGDVGLHKSAGRTTADTSTGDVVDLRQYRSARSVGAARDGAGERGQAA